MCAAKEVALLLIRWCGGIGRRKGLKIPRGQPRIGSSPITSSKGIREKRIPFFVK